MNRKVNTVLGPINPDKLGRTLMHEHLVFGYPGFEGDVTLGISREEALETALKATLDAKKLGLETIVDATPNECGRDPELLKEISERAGVNIICSTGYYCEAIGAPAYFKFRANNGYDIADEAYEMMMAEITSGIGKNRSKTRRY